MYEKLFHVFIQFQNKIRASDSTIYGCTMWCLSISPPPPPPPPFQGSGEEPQPLCNLYTQFLSHKTSHSMLESRGFPVVLQAKAIVIERHTHSTIYNDRYTMDSNELGYMNINQLGYARRRGGGGGGGGGGPNAPPPCPIERTPMLRLQILMTVLQCCRDISRKAIYPARLIFSHIAK